MAELIAGNAFVLTARGPAAPAALEPGADKLWVVTDVGALNLVELRSVSDAEQAQVWRLLTSVGDIALPEGAYVSTDGGRFLSGDELNAIVLRGERVDLDVISPSDVQFSRGSSPPGGEAIRYALAALPQETLQIPVANGAAKAVEEAVVGMLESAQVDYRVTCDDRWLVFALEGLPAASPLKRYAFIEQADALLLATTWELNGSRWVSRVRLGDALLLQSLITALVGAGRAFDVKWTPKYCPVECRVRALDDEVWGAFVSVDAASRETGPVFELNLGGSGRPVVGLTVTTSRL